MADKYKDSVMNGNLSLDEKFNINSKPSKKSNKVANNDNKDQKYSHTVGLD